VAIENRVEKMAVEMMQSIVRIEVFKRVTKGVVMEKNTMVYTFGKIKIFSRVGSKQTHCEKSNTKRIEHI
jgi:hypothetical protein